MADRFFPRSFFCCKFFHPFLGHFYTSFSLTLTTIFHGWMGSGYNLDPAKIGQEGYNLLKYYEQQLKALQVGKLVSQDLEFVQL